MELYFSHRSDRQGIDHKCRTGLYHFEGRCQERCLQLFQCQLQSCLELPFRFCSPWNYVRNGRPFRDIVPGTTPPPAGLGGHIERHINKQCRNYRCRPILFDMQTDIFGSVSRPAKMALKTLVRVQRTPQMFNEFQCQECNVQMQGDEEYDKHILWYPKHHVRGIRRLSEPR